MQVKILNAEEANQAINDYIQSLTESDFDKKANKRQKTFDNMFSALSDMLADLEYKGAINDLLNNVRSKADGLVDGSLKNDWIIDPLAQKEVCWKIDTFISYLKTLQ